MNMTRKRVFLSFYLLGRTYEIALQQVLKISTTFSKTTILVFFVLLCGVFLGSVFAILCFSSSKLSGLFE
jgi:hypothetical protein